MCLCRHQGQDEQQEGDPLHQSGDTAGPFLSLCTDIHAYVRRGSTTNNYTKLVLLKPEPEQVSETEFLKPWIKVAVRSVICHQLVSLTNSNGHSPPQDKVPTQVFLHLLEFQHALTTTESLTVFTSDDYEPICILESWNLGWFEY